MTSIFGKNIVLSMFGESHNKVMGITIHGVKAGIKIDKNLIDKELLRRRPSSIFSTSRVEEDDWEIVSGVFNDFTTGCPLTFLVYNKDIKSDNYNTGVIRPSHCDYTAYVESHGYNDYRGSGHFSGRLTVLICLVGAVCKQILSNHNIIITSKIKQLKDLKINDFDKQKEKIEELLAQTKSKNDSIGGLIEVKATGIEVGIGEPYFDSIESVLSHLFFSIPAVKAVEFGIGREFATKSGSEVLDTPEYKDSKIVFLSNNNGGINGGISNGCEIISTLTFKPTPTISQPIKTINISKQENITYLDKGRHDCAIVLRTGIIAEACMAIGLLDLLVTKYGREWM